MCVVFIPANTVGIKYSAISGVSEDTLSEGIAFKTPFDKVYKIDTTVQEKAMANLSVQTKDAQYVTMEINVKYSVNNSNAFKIFKSYKTLNNLQNNLIANATQRAVEEVTTKYNVIELLGEQRSTIYIEIENALKERLSNEGVDLNFITIVDTSASDSIEKAIEQEAVAQKNVETALQKQEQAKIEAQTKLIQAEGEAKANAVKTEALTDEVLMEMWINKWNGQLPKVSGADGTMIDISGLME
jgi:regulator of protease activity HflC (stomatin/prohibitin superfamily)